MDILTPCPQGQLETKGLINHLDRFKMMGQAGITGQKQQKVWCDEHHSIVCKINQRILLDR